MCISKEHSSARPIVTTSIIDPEADELRPVREIVQARLGKSISPATLWRWIRRGVGGVRLEVVRVGGSWFSTSAAFAEFLRAQTANAVAADSSDSPPATNDRSPSTLQKLHRAGLL